MVSQISIDYTDQIVANDTHGSLEVKNEINNAIIVCYLINNLIVYVCSDMEFCENFLRCVKIWIANFSPVASPLRPMFELKKHIHDIV